jgi:prepilin-type N-terminal cleavage/methylation domain-containing protein
MLRMERGYTLVEIMIALVITLVVAGALHDVLRSTQRLSRAQAGQAALQANLRTGALAVANELRELGTVAGGTAAQNDVLRATNATVVYRAMRGVGFLCQPSTTTALRIARTGFTGHRDPQPGRDSLYVLVTGDGAGTWLAVAIAGVSTAAECPGMGPGISLAIPSTDAVAGLESGTPVRITEVMELRLYQSEGKSWLGARSVSAGEAIQPLVGPLADGNGFSLEFRNGSGDPTLDLTRIRGIRAVLRGSLEGAAAAEQQLSTSVTLRSTAQP